MANPLYGNAEFIIGSKDMNLFSIEWLPPDVNPRAIVFICHGYAEHMLSGYFESLATHLNFIGCLVVGHDYAGHGRSQGRRGHFDNVDEPVTDVITHIEIIIQKHANLPIFILGYSFGGIIATLAVLKYPQLFSGLILESPALDYNRNKVPFYLVYVVMILGFCCPCMVIKNFTDSLSKNDPHRIHQLDAETACFLIRVIRKINKFELKKLVLPLLAVHGRNDDIVPFHSTVDFVHHAESPDKSFVIYNNTKHDLRYDNKVDTAAYIKYLQHWILARI